LAQCAVAKLDGLFGAMAANLFAKLAVAVIYACLASIGLCLSVTLKDNEVALPSGIHAETWSSLLEVGSQRHQQKIMQNMTLSHALTLMPPAPQELKTLIASTVGAELLRVSEHQAFLQMHSRRAGSAASTRSKAAASSRTSSMSADSARQLLNQMAQDTEKKLDIEKMRCLELAARQEQASEEVRQDIGEFNSQGAAARAHVLTSQVEIAGIQEKLPKLLEELEDHQRKCKNDHGSLKRQLGMVLQDITTLSRVVGMTKCSTGAAAAAGLVQCRAVQSTDPAVSLIYTGHRVNRVHTLQIHSSAAQRELGEVFFQEVADTHHNQWRRHQRLQRQLYRGQYWRGARRVHAKRMQSLGARRHRGMVQFRQGHSMRRFHGRMLQHRTMLRHVLTKARNAQAPGNSSNVPTNPKKQMRKCSIRTNPNCDQLKDKFLFMQAAVVEKSDVMKASLADMETQCKATQQNYDAQISDLQKRLKDQETTLAETTKTVIETQEQSRLKEQQLKEAKKETAKLKGDCKTNLDGLLTELCGVKQIRQEIYKMSNQHPTIQDCEVSAWTPEECSATCGGGTQRLTRSVVVPPSMGTSCPPLVMQRRCNPQACPVDCGLEDWDGWSSCSAECGGGIMERIREVTTQPMHGGKPCDPTTQSVSCNEQSCDEDCVLSEWGKWSACSKACNGGFNVREKSVIKRHKGQGTCPSTDAPERIEFKRCNMNQCSPQHSSLLRCVAKLDIILLLDGSGSVGSAGFDLLKQAAQKLIGAFQMSDAQAQIAVLLFSGPDSWPQYQKCTQGTATVDMATDCRVSWVSHFTTNSAQLNSMITSMQWPKGSTMTSAALGLAGTELQNGRKDATSVIITITDARPMNPTKTMQAARMLRKSARLIWVPVTSYAPIKEIQTWASRPVADNVLVIESYDELNEDKILNKLIADACPTVE